MKSKRPFDLKRYLIGVLRKASYRYPERYAARKAAVVPGTKPQEFRCNNCKGQFRNEDTQVDHIRPVVGVAGFTTWDAYIASLFVSKEDLQVLCRPCHKAKTLRENAARRAERMSKKASARKRKKR